MKLFAELQKVEENADGTLTVEGIASSECVDADGEVIKSAAISEALPDFFKFGTGALREMHQPIAAGTVDKAEVQDGKTFISATVVDPGTVEKVKKGVLKGFSVGGKCLGRDPDNRKTITKMRMTEISLVDRPCNPEAAITLVKVDSGDEEEVPLEELEKVAARKDVSDADKKAAEKEYGDVKYADEKNKKYPIDTVAHIRAAWNYINKEKNAAKYSAADVKSIKAKIVAAWKDKIDKDGPPSAAKKAEMPTLQKGMYTVSQLACAIDQVQWMLISVNYEAEAEGDGSKLPAMMWDWLSQGVELLNAMVAEETTEMLDALKPEEQEQAVEIVDPGAGTQIVMSDGATDDTKKADITAAESATEAANTVNKAEFEALNKLNATLNEELAKSQTQIGDLAKMVGELKETVAKLQDEPAISKVLRFVEKDEADREAKSQSVETVVVKNADGSIDKVATAMEQIKKVHSSAPMQMFPRVP